MIKNDKQDMIITNIEANDGKILHYVNHWNNYPMMLF